jgi:2'-5' RNA ligase
MENNVKFEYGCIMAIVDDSSANKIVEINKKLIPDDILYFEEGQEYGRETEPHVTIKYGLTTNYSESDIQKLVSYVKPFKITLTSIDLFKNPKFDVVKFNVESNVLRKLNKLISKLPNEDKYPVYNPHLTLAYVLPGEGDKFKKEIKPIDLNINKIKYSNSENKYYYSL